MKLIHHTAPSNRNDWHPLWIRCHHSWVNNHSGFEFQLWKDEDLDTFVNEKFPQYSKVYNNLPAHILKIDFARYCFLYEQGGIYADMDMYCYKSFYDELESDFTIIQSEFRDLPFRKFSSTSCNLSYDISIRDFINGFFGEQYMREF